MTKETPTVGEPELSVVTTTIPLQLFVRDCAVGSRPSGRDQVHVPGAHKPQTRPGGGYMDY